MASDQMPRRENTTTEREIRVEQNRVPKMTTHFEHLAEKAKESDVHPQGGTIEAVQGLEVSKDQGGKAIGDVGGRAQLDQSLSHNRVKGSGEKKERDQTAARNVDIVGGREGVGGGARSVGKFQMEKDEGGRGTSQQELERRTRVVSGRTEESGNKGRDQNIGQVVLEKGRGSDKRVGGGTDQGVTAVITCKFEGGGEQKGVQGRAEEKTRAKNEQKSNIDEISKYRGQAQENANKVLSDVQQRYQSAKQAASETLSSATQTAQERSAQAKNTTVEKASQAKDTTMEKASQAKDTAVEKASQAKDIAVEKASQAKDTTLEKGQQGLASTKDTLTSAVKTASEYTAPVAEKAKDVTVETGKTAAGYAGKVAVDLKDKATVAGWTAANFSAEKTVDVTKAAANVVQGVAGYAGHKAAELAAMSVDTAKGLAATVGETAKEYTARKKEEAQREYEAKRGPTNQVLDD